MISALQCGKARVIDKVGAVNRLLYATRDGRLRIDDTLQATARSGWEVGVADRLIPLPAGATLVHLPGRIPQGRSADGRIDPVREAGAVAVGAVLPPGYLRTWLPAYVDDGRPPVLPLYGYAAVAAIDGEPHVAAMRTIAGSERRGVRCRTAGCSATSRPVRRATGV